MKDQIDNQKTIRILVDDRENNDRLLLALKEKGNVEVCVSRLTVGDYVLENLVVERKTLNDLCMSIIDGRLFRQAAQLSSSVRQPLLILEGSTADLKISGLRREAIQGALITISLIYRIPILRSLSQEETANLILCASNQIGRACLSGKSYPRPFRSKNVISQKKRRQLRILQGFPGIGAIRAQKLLAAFETLSAIFNKPAKELAQVPGISKAAAQRIFDILQ